MLVFQHPKFESRWEQKKVFFLKIWPSTGLTWPSLPDLGWRPRLLGLGCSFWKYKPEPDRLVPGFGSVRFGTGSGFQDPVPVWTEPWSGLRLGLSRVALVRVSDSSPLPSDFAAPRSPLPALGHELLQPPSSRRPSSSPLARRNEMKIGI